MLDKKDRFKRSSNVSTTPSTDSSKSSKTFEFIDYDEETKEKVLEAAIREEDAFLEFVAGLKIEVDPIVETRGGGPTSGPGCGNIGKGLHFTNRIP